MLPDQAVLVLQAHFIRGSATPLRGRWLRKFRPEGKLNPGFQPPSLDDAIRQVGVLPNGKIVIGGYNQTFGLAGQSRRQLARLFPDGSLDLGFNAGLTAEQVDALAISPDGRHVLVGLFILSTRTTPAQFPLRLLRADSPLLSRVERMADGSLRSEVHAAPGTRVVLERSPDLRHWVTVEEVTLPPGGVLPRTHPPATGADGEFLRARPVP